MHQHLEPDDDTPPVELTNRLCIICNRPMGHARGRGCDSCREVYQLTVLPKIRRGEPLYQLQGGLTYRQVGGALWVNAPRDDDLGAVGRWENGVRAMEGDR